MWHAMGRKICQPYTYFTSDRESAPYFILTSAGRAQKYATRRATARRAAQHFAGPHPGRTRQISRFLKCSRSGRTGPVPFWIFCCTSPRTPTVHPLRRRSPQGSPMPSCSPCHACRHLYLSMCCTSRQGLVWRLVLALALYWCRALAALVRLGAVRLYLPRLHLMSTHSLARGQGLVWPGAAWPSPGRALAAWWVLHQRAQSRSASSLTTA